MENTKVTTATKPACPSPMVKAPAAAAPAVKSTVPQQLKDAARTTDTVCKEIAKKILTSKQAAMPDVCTVDGLKKDDIMKLVELLDAMGSATYKTACELRELNNKMK